VDGSTGEKSLKRFSLSSIRRGVRQGRRVLEGHAMKSPMGESARRKGGLTGEVMPRQGAFEKGSGRGVEG